MKRALFSVYDKAGVLEFARELAKFGYEIVSTGGTKRYLAENGVAVIDISEVTGFPEVMDGRVKTLHPRIHAGILARRDMESDLETLNEHSISEIDIVVNNLYPFEQTLKREGVSHAEIIENIDIGGPSMIRAAAKNYNFVTVIVDPKDYARVLDELNVDGCTTLETRQYLAGKVFNLTAYYDALISQYFNMLEQEEYPEYYVKSFKRVDKLRYGENPHQNAAYYSDALSPMPFLPGAEVLNGKPLSYNNINDTNAALLAVNEYELPAVVAVKHANPCGIAVDEKLSVAFTKARDCDSESIFGGIIALNRCVDAETARLMSEIFLEVIVAPDYDADALEILKAKKNLRVLKLPELSEPFILTQKSKSVLGGLIVQDPDYLLFGENMRAVTKLVPPENVLNDMIFAYQAAKHTASNSIVVAKDNATLGIGQGSVNRMWAVKEAIERAGDKIDGAVLASDGFFPFTDSIKIAHEAGIKYIIQPGGSIKDDEVIAACDEYGIAMVFTDMRHFKH